MSESMSCGQGLASRATLPAALSEVAVALAEVLSCHERSVVSNDASSTAELQAYEVISARFRASASMLRSAAELMLGARGLPAARHDTAVLRSPENAAAFERFVASERELLALMQKALEQDGAILHSMR